MKGRLTEVHEVQIRVHKRGSRRTDDLLRDHRFLPRLIRRIASQHSQHKLGSGSRAGRERRTLEREAGLGRVRNRSCGS